FGDRLIFRIRSCWLCCKSYEALIGIRPVSHADGFFMVKRVDSLAAFQAHVSSKAVRMDLILPLPSNVMKALAILLTSLLLSVWIGAIAILAIQNFTHV
ncbi:MAG TPA: hypothetical protein V6C50_09885, partial [Crinalium sp.]